jgi:hypothetical protein
MPKNGSKRHVSADEEVIEPAEREVSARTFKGENMEQVIERLRVSKGQYLQAQQGQGRKDGINWARLFANYAELKALSQFEPEGERLGGRAKLHWSAEVIAIPVIRRLGHRKPGRDAFVYPCLHLIASISLTSMGAFASHGEVEEPDVGRAP